ncbi:uncharacterized protein Z519_08321 [Cladophialophora bantiana CBS 173.52]|uniref:Uncharacterized protein n=1 Tax=Cladophialophora bantiana (strain ATCC 10958 / CBS 173.52 / CDC B-1940 / NIH 8579) TaxID=1442370 RepID=A0A0D2HKZ8_CLAB1|nr:uncharacterized protein Z519_08321 [Cladophialophora bantiana CBS 173.52]KIW91425.1 hypothetical protein Z519_08321 [Cladophialophora bantiana CBS 173.52]
MSLPQRPHQRALFSLLEDAIDPIVPFPTLRWSLGQPHVRTLHFLAGAREAQVVDIVISASAVTDVSEIALPSSNSGIQTPSNLAGPQAKAKSSGPDSITPMIPDYDNDNDVGPMEKEQTFSKQDGFIPL